MKNNQKNKGGNDDNRIFTSHFRGTIDDLLDFCSTRGDAVAEVVEGKKEIYLSQEEILAQIYYEFPNITDEEAHMYLEEFSSDQAASLIEAMLESGDIETVGYDDNGQELYALTATGKENHDDILKSLEQNLKNINKKKNRDDDEEDIDEEKD